MQPALAVTYDEIPDSIKQRLPEFLLTMLDPAALAALSLEDLEEFADAYQFGKMRFVADVIIERSGGPLTPEQATLILQIPQGAPYIEERFVRIAKAAYGNGLFASLQWAVYENTDGSVNIHLWYSSRDSEQIIPDISFDSIAGFLYGVRYQDLYYGGENKQLTAGIQTNEEYAREVYVHGSWTDNTLNNGKNSYSISASVQSDWRERMKKTTNQMNIRHRTARLDGSYSWNGVDLGNLGGAITTGAGLYSQDYYVLAMHEDIADGLPRMDVTQEGAGGYVSLAYSGAKRDMIFTPHDGHYFVARAEQHLGDFNFTRFKLDIRKYKPAGNVFGHREQQVQDNLRMDIARQFPTASIAMQVQSVLETGDVPFSQEIRLDSTRVARGFLHDSVVGTKLVSGRMEYRFDLDKAGEYEMYLFSDHAGLGETLDNLEGFHSWGVGSILTVPIYGGFKLGGYYGFSYDGADDGWGLAFGYQF
jgi:hypothetical protein